ncbi:metallophosphoesterase family protein [Gluconobacter kanchanaburiensis]|uniref:Metallophosphoesterase n=1 Tax=Gluconobacter kanchanaburiensis NBRC 103587 TaxID=1307948 RepID=A0A511B718_9PROT|nr:metallophosphoesterase [Gluconobacter kanchanaburiensis]MBF0860561.1 metallophosphoesterase [Gluconobacter kanchanaburiensis]GBR69361.1 metallophosphoesterase [Gluconobacter kanchanaburiensis NBRC 103587]GEK96188.1 metallophosphoesterase [Gluconobacter kanchanaburiensis NBRC 103587]
MTPDLPEESISSREMSPSPISSVSSSALTLAHISDPHLPPPPVHWREALNKRALSLLSWKKHRQYVHLAQTCAALVKDIGRSNVDTVLVSGDLTNFGTPDEFDAAARWLEGLPAQALVIPGNHDCMVRQSVSKGIAKWERWSAQDYPYVRIQNGIAIVGINSGIPTPPFMACGRVGRRQREKLEALLERLGREGLCRVVMIHHPPKRGLVPWRKSLLDHREVAAVFRRVGAEIVLHGHSHDATLTHIDGTDIPLLGVASASLTDERPHRQACWNRLCIRPYKGGWSIDLARHRPDGSVSERASWTRPEGHQAGRTQA